jgi:D-alanyl-D-alanine carboxypeptidase/D-alanyl-D-alanine-endopeptidase (penicillin-binding protein 4)
MKYILSLLFSIVITNAFGQVNTAINKFVQQPNLSHSSIGICVKDMNGKEIAAYNSRISLIPASTLKILTTATALEILGEEYRFPTELSIDKNDPQHLIVQGYGDPTLGSEYINSTPSLFLDNWANQVIKNLPKNKPVSITIADNYFGYDGVSSKWLREDMGNYYAAGAYGISIFDNTYRLYFNTTGTDIAPQIVKTVPEMKDIKFLNTLQFNTTGKDNGYIYGEPFSNSRKLVGDIPAKKTSFVIKGDIPDPGLMLGKQIANKLEMQGYTIKKVDTFRDFYFEHMYDNSKPAPYQSTIFYKYNSPNLKDIIRVINVRSNNHYTEHLIRAIGRSSNKDIYSNALTEGIKQTDSFWKQKGINTDALHMYDGCGLAPSNNISPEMLCDVLLYMQNKSRYADAFLASFPKAGREGTVKNFLKGSRLEGLVHVKSGSIANVQCFSGYYMNGDKKYAFTIMVNNFNSPHREVVRAIETLLLSIF